MAQEGSAESRMRTLLARSLETRLVEAPSLRVSLDRWFQGSGRLVCRRCLQVSIDACDAGRYEVFADPQTRREAERSVAELAPTLKEVGHGPHVGPLSAYVASFEVPGGRALQARLRNAGFEDLFAYFLHQPSSEQIFTLCAPVHAGEPMLDERSQQAFGILGRLLSGFLMPAPRPFCPQETPSILDLSESQLGVYKLAIRGLTEKQIALRLHRSPHTVHSHLKAVYRALRVTSRAELLALHMNPPTSSGEQSPHG